MVSMRVLIVDGTQWQEVRYADWMINQSVHGHLGPCNIFCSYNEADSEEYVDSIMTKPNLNSI